MKIATYAVSGLLAGIAAVLYVAQYRQGKPDAGAGLELDAIAAVVIGGTSLMGGRGSLAGTFCGVLIFGLLSNILQLHNINSNLQLVLKGLIIIGTVLVQERNAADLLRLSAPAGPAAGAQGSGRRQSGRRTRPCLETSEETQMKRREFLRLAALAAALAASDRASARLGDAFAQDKKWKIGFSQATTIEPWRAQFNKDIIAEAAKHPEVELIITDGEDKTEKQVADVENLIRQEVDALLDLAEGIGRPDRRRRSRRSMPRSRSSCSTATSTPTSTRSSSAATTS